MFQFFEISDFQEIFFKQSNSDKFRAIKLKSSLQMEYSIPRAIQFGNNLSMLSTFKRISNLLFYI